jgi:hypothetical protein
MASSLEASCVLVLESSWCNDVTVVVSLLLGAAAALDEEPVRPITMKVGSERHTVWSAQRGVWCAQGARFLGCTSLRVTANSSLRRDRRFVCHARLNPGSGLCYTRCGAR